MADATQAQPRREREYRKCHDGAQWVFRRADGSELSVICHGGSYGGTRGYFEAYADGCDCIGWLDFDQAARIIALFMAGNKDAAKFDAAAHPPNYREAAEAINEEGTQ